MKVQDLGFNGSEFRVWGLRFGAWVGGLAFRVSGPWFKAWRLKFKV